MSFTLYHYGSGDQVGMTLTVTGRESIASFRDIFSRACNTWDEAPTEVKEIHDTVIHGRPLQDYKSQKR